MSKKRANCSCKCNKAQRGDVYRKPTLLFRSESDRRRYARDFPKEYAEMGKEDPA